MSIDRAQRDYRQHRPFREPEQSCRAERGDSHRTEAEFLTQRHLRTRAASWLAGAFPGELLTATDERQALG
jgi:hypothetical protein